MGRVAWIGVLAFLVALAVQWWLWQVAAIPDGDLWEERIGLLRDDIRTSDYRADFDGYSNHPGMSILLPGAGLALAGVEIPLALRGVMALMNAVCAAGITVLAYLLRPRLWWWLVAGAMAAAHPLYPHMSPTSAVFGAMIVWLALLTMWIAENRNSARRLKVILLWGVAAGWAGVTRFPETVLLAGPLWLFLLTRVRLPLALLALGSGTVIFWAANPLLSHEPWQHIRFLLRRSSLLYASAGQGLRLSDFVLFAPLAVAGVAWSLAALAWRRFQVGLPRALLLVLLGMTGLLSAAFLAAPAQSLRHFFPLILLWEICLAWWMLDFLERAVPDSRRRFLRIVSLGLLAGGQVFLLILVLL